MSDHDHPHHRDHGQEPPSDLALRVKALESLLVDKGLVDPAALDAIVETYEHKIGPRNGAKVVARAWQDPAYRARLLEDSTAEVRYLVLPERPAGTETFGEDALAALVSRDAMIGVARVRVAA